VHEPNAMKAVVGWLDAVRRGDIDAATEWFDPQVSWRGLGDAACRNRVEVLEMLGDSFIPCPEDPASFDLEPGLRGAEAVELVSPDAQTVVLGAKVAGMSEVDGVWVDGQLFNVFRCGADGLSRSPISRGGRRHSPRQVHTRRDGCDD
jgi:hypothetical protein